MFITYPYDICDKAMKNNPLDLLLVVQQSVTHARVKTIKNDTCDNKKKWKQHLEKIKKAKETHAKVKKKKN